jgi:hypothetical protein
MFIVTVLFFYDLNCPRLFIMIFFFVSRQCLIVFIRTLQSSRHCVSSLPPLESLFSRNNWTIKHLFFLLKIWCCWLFVRFFAKSRIRPWNEPKNCGRLLHSILNYVIRNSSKITGRLWSLRHRLKLVYYEQSYCFTFKQSKSGHNNLIWNWTGCPKLKSWPKSSWNNAFLSTDESTDPSTFWFTIPYKSVKQPPVFWTHRKWEE